MAQSVAVALLLGAPSPGGEVTGGRPDWAEDLGEAATVALLLGGLDTTIGTAAFQRTCLLTTTWGLHSIILSDSWGA